MFKKSLVIILIALATVQVQAGWFSSLIRSVVNIIVQVPIIGNLVDAAANSYAHRKLNSTVDGLINSGRSCTPRERDDGHDVEFWISQKPGLPDWQELDKLNRSKDSLIARGNEFGKNDKLKHCYVGCLIGKEVGYSSAVFTAWYKELQDLSDCNLSTHFEIQDKEATVGGAVASRKTSCESFCGRGDLANASGSQILEAAQDLSIKPTIGSYNYSRARYRMMEP